MCLHSNMQYTPSNMHTILWASYQIRKIVGCAQTSNLKKTVHFPSQHDNFFYFDVLTDFHYFPLDSSYARAVDVQHRFNPDLIPKIISELKSIRDASDEFWKSAHLLVSGWFESPLLSVHRSLQDLDQMILDDLNSAFWWVLVVLPWLHSKCREMS